MTKLLSILMAHSLASSINAQRLRFDADSRFLVMEDVHSFFPLATIARKLKLRSHIEEVGMYLAKQKEQVVHMIQMVKSTKRQRSKTTKSNSISSHSGEARRYIGRLIVWGDRLRIEDKSLLPEVFTSPATSGFEKWMLDGNEYRNSSMSTCLTMKYFRNETQDVEMEHQQTVFLSYI